VLLESLALGKVVIASETGGLPELITPGKTGFLFANSDVSDLAQKIVSLDDYNLEDIGLAAKKVVANLTLDKHHQKLLELYQRVVRK
jgi:glycosyltransferase involved in cell wall biosynthesis